MLLNDFFTFTDLQTEGNTVKTHIELNAGHPIFKGHFPGQPILPGVCMMQIVKEVLEAHLNQQTRLVKAHDLKFLAFIHPEQNKAIQLELTINKDADLIKTDARLLDGATVFFKFKGTFTIR